MSRRRDDDGRNPDFAFALDELHQQVANASFAHRDLDFDKATRHLRLAARAMADLRRANNDMSRWAGQAERFERERA